MRVVVSGASGLIGSALVPALEGGGHEVVRLVRSAPKGPNEVRWDPAAGTIDTAGLAGVEGAVHLAGEGIGEKRWSSAQKQKILDSRVQGTRLLAGALAGLDPKPAVLVSASGIGYYGLRGDEVLTEESSAGSGFLADVVQQWEASTVAAEQAGIRTVHLRSGIVLTPDGGSLGQMLPLFKLGLGGRLGSGKQWWSWVSLPDEIGLILHTLNNESVTGPLNACSPNPATNAEITKMLAQVLSRPAFLPVPKFALALVKGSGLTEELIMAGQRALPKVAEATGYRFAYGDLGAALRMVVAK